MTTDEKTDDRLSAERLLWATWIEIAYRGDRLTDDKDLDEYMELETEIRKRIRETTGLNLDVLFDRAQSAYWDMVREADTKIQAREASRRASDELWQRVRKLLREGCQPEGDDNVESEPPPKE